MLGGVAKEELMRLLGIAAGQCKDRRHDLRTLTASRAMHANSPTS